VEKSVSVYCKPLQSESFESWQLLSYVCIVMYIMTPCNDSGGSMDRSCGRAKSVSVSLRMVCLCCTQLTIIYIFIRNECRKVYRQKYRNKKRIIKKTSTHTSTYFDSA